MYQSCKISSLPHYLQHGSKVPSAENTICSIEVWPLPPSDLQSLLRCFSSHTSQSSNTGVIESILSSSVARKPPACVCVCVCLYLSLSCGCQSISLIYSVTHQINLQLSLLFQSLPVHRRLERPHCWHNQMTSCLFFQTCPSLRPSSPISLSPLAIFLSRLNVYF